MSILVKNKRLKKILSLIILTAAIQVSAQSCICKYYQFIYWEADALDTFTFTNGESVKVCPAIRYNFEDDTKLYFKDFAIEHCKSDSIVFVGKSRTFYTLQLNENILVAEEIMDLATGVNRKMERIALSSNQIYFQDGELKVKQRFNPIRKYSSGEIATTIQEYEKSRRISARQLRLLSSRLFMAALSDEKAKKYFLNMQAKHRDKTLAHYQNLVGLFSEIQQRQ